MAGGDAPDRLLRRCGAEGDFHDVQTTRQQGFGKRFRVIGGIEDNNGDDAFGENALQDHGGMGQVEGSHAPERVALAGSGWVRSFTGRNSLASVRINSAIPPDFVMTHQSAAYALPVPGFFRVLPSQQT